MKSPTRTLQTSKGLITYQTHEFIEEVGKRPVLWLKSEMKKRAAIETAWNDVSQVYVPFFDQLNNKEQLMIVEHFKTTWRRTVKGLMKNYCEKESGNTKAPLYRYTRDLEFFLKSRGLNIENVASKQELEELDRRMSKRNLPNPRKIRKVIDLSVDRKKVKIDHVKNNLELTKPIVQDCQVVPTVQDDNSVDIRNICNGNSFKHNYRQELPQYNTVKVKQLVVQSADDDADQAFFDSLKPTLCKLNDSQKLEFMIQVLKVLKKY